MAEEEAPPPVRATATLAFEDDDAVATTYATAMVVFSTDNETILRFYEARPPAKLTGTEDKIPARCVARIVVATSNLPKFSEVLQRNVKAREERKAGKEG